MFPTRMLRGSAWLWQHGLGTTPVDCHYEASVVYQSLKTVLNFQEVYNKVRYPVRPQWIHTTICKNNDVDYNSYVNDNDDADDKLY